MAIDIKHLSLIEVTAVISVAEMQSLMNKQMIEISQQGDHEDALQRNLLRDNLTLFQIPSDGNCLFNSFAHQLHVVIGHPLLDHMKLRTLFCDTLDANPTFWRQFVPGSEEAFKQLITDMRKPGEWKNNLADIALNVLGVIFQVDVNSYRGNGISTYHWSSLSTSDPMREKTPVLSLVYSGAHYHSTTFTNAVMVNDEPIDLTQSGVLDQEVQEGVPPSAPGIVHLVGDDIFSPGHIFGDWESVKQSAIAYSKTRFFQHRLKNQTNAKGLKTARIVCSRSWKTPITDENEDVCVAADN